MTTWFALEVSAVHGVRWKTLVVVAESEAYLTTVVGDQRKRVAKRSVGEHWHKSKEAALESEKARLERRIEDEEKLQQFRRNLLKQVEKEMGRL